MRGNFEWMEDPTALNIIQHAVRRVHFKFGGKFGEIEDMTQEAYIMVATTANLLEPLAAGEYGLLQHRLEQDLTDLLDKEVRRTERNISYDALVDAQEDASEEGGSSVPYVMVETISNDYTREMIEILLPAVWDDSYTYGLPTRDTAPDPDMPKGSSNKATANNLAAYIADIKTGWAKAPLTLKERQAIVLRYRDGLLLDQIVERAGVGNHSTIQRRIETALGKIQARLNGGYWYELAQGSEGNAAA